MWFNTRLKESCVPPVVKNRGNGTWFLSEEHEADDEPGAKFEYTDYYTAFGSSKCPPLDSWVCSLFACIMLSFD